MGNPVVKGLSVSVHEIRVRQTFIQCLHAQVNAMEKYTEAYEQTRVPADRIRLCKAMKLADQTWHGLLSATKGKRGGVK